MKKLFFIIPHFIVVVIICTLLFISCKKSSPDANTFVWTFKTNTYFADWYSAYLSSRSPTPIIIAGIGANVNQNIRVSISLTSFNRGTYTLGSGSSNSLYFVDENGVPLNTITGTTTITENNNSRLSGTFNATLADISGSQNAVSGSFTNILVYQ